MLTLLATLLSPALLPALHVRTERRLCGPLSPAASLVLVLVLPWALACESDSLRPPPPAPEKLYWALELDHHAVMLSTAPSHNTLQLTATPRNARGEPLAELSAPRYTSLGAENVTVSPEGMLQARAASNTPIAVVATLTAGGVTHADTVFVGVVDADPPPVLASFSVHPTYHDSAKVPVARGPGSAFGLLAESLSVSAADPGGVPLQGLAVHFRSSDPTIATIHATRGEVKGLRLGEVAFYATTTAFGIAKADTLSYRIGWPSEVRVQVNPETNSFVPSEVRVGTGAIVTWAREPNPTDTFDITFATADLPNVSAGSTWGPGPFTRNSTFLVVCAFFVDCASTGDVVIAAPTAFAVRVFSEPGTYVYHSARYGTGGRIVVVDER